MIWLHKGEQNFFPISPAQKKILLAVFQIYQIQVRNLGSTTSKPQLTWLNRHPHWNKRTIEKKRERWHTKNILPSTPQEQTEERKGRQKTERKDRIKWILGREVKKMVSPNHISSRAYTSPEVYLLWQIIRRVIQGAIQL